MRICHIITRLIVGGAQENTLLTCEELAARGHDVVLLAGPETGPEGSMWDRARRGGYRVRCVPSLRRAIDPARDWQCLQELRGLLAEVRPDIVHTHSSKAGVLGRVAARDVGVPIIVHTIHGMSFNRTQSWPIRWAYAAVETWCATFTDAFISVADAMTTQAVEAGLAPPERFTTIYSGVVVDLFDPARYDRLATRRSWGFPDDCIVVGTIARLFRHKGYEQLIPAMAQAARQDERLRFVWVGDGPDRTRHEAWLKRLGLRERVRLVGLVPPEAIPQQLAGMDMLVHASRWEGLPRVVVQASLMAVPCVAVALDGAPEVIDGPDVGVLVPPDDVDALADAIRKLTDAGPASRQQMGQQARMRCLQRFDHRRMVEQIERLYLRLVQTKCAQHT